MSIGKQSKNIFPRMNFRDSYDDKENLCQSPGLKMKDVMASSSLADVVSNKTLTTNKASTTNKEQKKMTSQVPPLMLMLPTSNSFSSPLRPTAEEFRLPLYVSNLPSTNYLSPFPLSPPFSPPTRPDHHQRHSGVTAVVEQPGFISLRLRNSVVLDISANLAIRLKNNAKESSISLSTCTTQLALVHPMGRMLQYGPRVEVQTEDDVNVKNAKIYPRGVSFTANNMALVYLLDEAGARSTSDMFHDLYATQIADTLFEESCQRDGVAITTSIGQLDKAKYWRTELGVDCWVIEQIFIQQTEDGLVIVERQVKGDKFVLRTSPTNGKVRMDSRMLHMTASLGDESHMFLRSGDRRLHYSGHSKVFTVRNAGHSAGFDEEGSLRIF